MIFFHINIFHFFFSYSSFKKLFFKFETLEREEKASQSINLCAIESGHSLTLWLEAFHELSLFWLSSPQIPALCKVFWDQITRRYFIVGERMECESHTRPGIYYCMLLTTNASIKWDYFSNMLLKRKSIYIT